jgi:hypothetical protein
MNCIELYPCHFPVLQGYEDLRGIPPWDYIIPITLDTYWFVVSAFQLATLFGHMATSLS